MQIILFLTHFFNKFSVSITLNFGKTSCWHLVPKKYNCDYLYANKRLGYPSQPYGYRMDAVIEWLVRFYTACVRSLSQGSTHMMLVEDDVAVVANLGFWSNMLVKSVEPLLGKPLM